MAVLVGSGLQRRDLHKSSLRAKCDRAMAVAGSRHGSNLMILNLTAGFIGLFAVAYALVAVDPVTFRVFIPFSIGGKLMAVAIVVEAWLEGSTSWRVPALASGDILFAIAFWHFLRRSGADPP
jgi:hypothetical protein